MPTWLIITLSIIYLASVLIFAAIVGGLQLEATKKDDKHAAKTFRTLLGCSLIWPIPILYITLTSLLKLFATPFTTGKEKQ